mgnify:FL=1|tara:strand:- start:783 stop:929 length:147 start_codon:yes stop_codon:yes gene_type:complete
MFEVMTALFLAMIIGGFFMIVTVLYYVALAMLILWIASLMWNFFFGRK